MVSLPKKCQIRILLYNFSFILCKIQYLWNKIDPWFDKIHIEKWKNVEWYYVYKTRFLMQKHVPWCIEFYFQNLLHRNPTLNKFWISLNGSFCNDPLKMSTSLNQLKLQTTLLIFSSSIHWQNPTIKRIYVDTFMVKVKLKNYW